MRRFKKPIPNRITETLPHLLDYKAQRFSIVCISVNFNCCLSWLNLA